MRRPAGHLRPALSLKPPPTLAEPRPAVSGRDCRSEFRHARSRTPAPDGVLAVVGVTDGVWQGGPVMSTPRRGPCRASRHNRGRRKTPRAPCLTLPTNPRSYLLSPERHLPRMVPAASIASRCEACYGVPAATCTRYRRRAPSVAHLPTRGTARCAPEAFSLTAMIILRPACAERGLVRMGTALGGRAWRARESHQSYRNQRPLAPSVPHDALFLKSPPPHLCYF